MSAVTEHLEQRGSAFELLAHRQVYTATDEARALGIDAGEVLKTLAVRTGPGYVLVVIPASRRLDLHLVREALADHQARLATEEELGRDFASYQLGALPPLGTLLGSQLFIDPEVLGHDLVVFAAGTQTESVRIRTRELFASEQVTTVPLVEQADRGSDDPVGRRRAPSAVAGSEPATPHRSPGGLPLTTPLQQAPGFRIGLHDGAVASRTVWVSPTSRGPQRLWV
jgi:Ala-tRNA(Pro) deacylase